MILKEISGKKRAFEFGTRTFVFIHELTGVKVIDEVFERLANKRKKLEIKPGDNDPFESEPIVSEIEHIEFIVKFMFACAKTGSEFNDEPIDYSLAKVYSWFDELGYENSMNLLNQLIEVYAEKNLKAPLGGLKKEAA